ncbi:MAG: ribosome maturation factor RimP [Acidimicrobiia bacterium]|nr:ribosome maturation factor RimP [Acidimicrobiia bacterium]MYC57279.1 ribosome maturation factor RimP [Acidimicrobiia bacterium]MYG94483.1 ribosome maturation factor RimP [Acidimicrobiia bacterium]MYI30931.1 ribosome maturation factor RimP [Acidimicrobiia bacterium]
MSVAEAANNLLAPIFKGRGLDLYDLTYGGGVLRVIVDKPGGINLDEVADVSKVVSRLLDDYEICGGHYTLEISSPGLERSLRSPEHFMQAIGETISLKLGSHVVGERRIEGVLLGCEADSISVKFNGVAQSVALSDISKARTKFEWGSTPKKNTLGCKTEEKSS